MSNQGAAQSEPSPTNWAQMRERGSAWGPMFLAYIYKLLGRGVCLALMALVVLFFYLTGRAQRRASQAYLARVWRFSGRPSKPGFTHGIRHFLAFGVALVDRFGAWVGDLKRDQIERIDDPLFNHMREDPQGALILSAHIGSVDIVRAMAAQHQRRVVNVVLHMAHAEQFNRAVARFAPNSQVRLISAADFDMATAMTLSAAVERGEWVVFMADRTAIKGGDRTISMDFLGAPARFPLGPFVFARSVRLPTYLLVCYKKNGKSRVRFSQIADAGTFQGPDRRAVLAALVESYVRILEDILKDAPYQWFNFYDFWSVGREASGT